METTVANLQPLRFVPVQSTDNALFRQFIQRYHYLGYRIPTGAHLHYFVQAASGQMLACLQWSSPAWKMAARDHWIGWSSQQRVRNLQYIVNNSRFLILPWVRVKGLASSILALAARQLIDDWRQHYGYSPLLLETLVDTPRFNGTCYRAANWIDLGETSGRGRMDRHHRAEIIPKTVFVFPLRAPPGRSMKYAMAPIILVEGFPNIQTLSSRRRGHSRHGSPNSCGGTAAAGFSSRIAANGHAAAAVRAPR